MDQTTNTYDYSPLSLDQGEFRVIVLSPGDGNAIIECSLVHVFARDDPKYEAVSYAWGDPQVTLPILLQGQQFRITTNLELALRHLRLQNKPRVLWVDALCINQSDNIERSLQVESMRVIYQAATKVLAWLGDENEGIAMFFRLVSEQFNSSQHLESQDLLNAMLKVQSARLSVEVRLLTFEKDFEDQSLEILSTDIASVEMQMQQWKSKVSKAISVLKDQGRKAQRSRVSKMLKSGVIEKWADVLNDDEVIMASDAITDFVGRPWWERIWVVQEVGVAREVVFVCGSLSSSWDELRFVSDFKASRSIGTDYQFINNMASIFVHPQTGKRPNLSVLDLLGQFRYCKATDARDKIYALLGLATDIGPSSFPVSYEIPANEVYRNFVRYLISRDGNLDVLGHVFDRDPSSVIDSKLPSWTPDWTTFSDCKAFRKTMETTTGARPLYCTAGNSIASIHVVDDPVVLQLKGFLFDTIICLGELGGTHPYKTPCTESWGSLALNDLHLGCPYKTRSGRLDAFWRTLIADTIENTRASEETFKLFEVWYDLANVPGNKEDITDSYARAVHNATCRRRIFISKRGYMGLAPSAALSGDLVCILFGGRMPFIARENGPYFKLIGEAYIHGIMDGEAIQAFENGEYGQWDFSSR